MDASKIISIKKLQMKILNWNIAKKAGKFSEKISDIFVIETKEKFIYQMKLDIDI